MLDEDANIRRIRRAIRAKKKSKSKFKPQKKLKYGAEVPNNIEATIKLDETNDNT